MADIVYGSSIFTIHHYIVIILEILATLLTSFIFFSYSIMLLSVSISIADLALIPYTFIGISISKVSIILFIFSPINYMCYELKYFIIESFILLLSLY